MLIKHVLLIIVRGPKGCYNTVGSARGLTLAKSGVGSSAFYSITLLSGICGSLCRSYIPVFALQESLQLRITFANSNQFGAWGAAPTTASNANFKFNNIEFPANMIKLSEPILAMVKAQNYTIFRNILKFSTNSCCCWIDRTVNSNTIQFTENDIRCST